VRHATCEVLCRGGVYPLPPRSSGTHHLSEGDTRVAGMWIPILRSGSQLGTMRR
jgi:hypothetical protein